MFLIKLRKRTYDLVNSIVHVRKEFLILLFFTSCYTEIKKPDDDFMKQVKQQANLDAGLKTLIKLNPRKLYFVKKKNSGPIGRIFLHQKYRQKTL